MVKSNPCKLCSSTYHTAAFCPLKPKKPIKRSSIKKATYAEMAKAKKAYRKLENKSTAKLLKKPKKKPAESRSKLVKKLDDIFSKYIRYSAVESDGMVQCVTCPTRLPPQNMQNGHFISRGKYPTRWHEDNCHPQCMRDNVFLKGAYIEYTMFMIDTYGRDHVEELRTLAKSRVKVSTPWIKEQIVKYDSLVKDMLQ